MTKKTAITEKQLWTGREARLENIIDELKDENVHLIESNNGVRSRIAEMNHARVQDDGNSANQKVIEDLHAELCKATFDLHQLQENVASNPNLAEAVLDAEKMRLRDGKWCIIWN